MIPARLDRKGGQLDRIYDQVTGTRGQLVGCSVQLADSSGEFDAIIVQSTGLSVRLDRIFDQLYRMAVELAIIVLRRRRYGFSPRILRKRPEITGTGPRPDTDYLDNGGTLCRGISFQGRIHHSEHG